MHQAAATRRMLLRATSPSAAAAATGTVVGSPVLAGPAQTTAPPAFAPERGPAHANRTNRATTGCTR
jgi:hypothetical protein